MAWPLLFTNVPIYEVTYVGRPSATSSLLCCQVYTPSATPSSNQKTKETQTQSRSWGTVSLMLMPGKALGQTTEPLLTGLASRSGGMEGVKKDAGECQQYGAMMCGSLYHRALNHYQEHLQPLGTQQTPTLPCPPHLPLGP